MMPFVRLIPHSDHGNTVGPGAVSVDQKRQGKGADMPSHTGTHSHAHDQGKSQRIPKVIQISQPQHKIRFLIAHRRLRDEIIIPEVLFCPLQLHHGNGGFRRGSEELLSGLRGAGCQACRICAVSGLIRGRNDLKGHF